MIGFFQEIAASQPHSYGKLHVRDDEGTRGLDYRNAMREWTMARGVISEGTDCRMSPSIPKIESELPPQSD
ncbi:MAG: hypothetical protein GY811_10990 [Myxococcales bacterium]|nr:hypothetical protein [Myxococcales bacterium]